MRHLSVTFDFFILHAKNYRNCHVTSLKAQVCHVKSMNDLLCFVSIFSEKWSCFSSFLPFQVFLI